MTNLAQIKKRFFTIIAVLAAIDVVLIVYLLWPGSASGSRKAQVESLKEKKTVLTRQVAPLKDIDAKLVKTRSDIGTLYQEWIPDRWSQISDHLDKLARDAGVTPQAIHYTSNSGKGDLPDVQRIAIDTSVTGEYGKVARFINDLEQDKLMFIITQISLSGKEAGTVTLQIKLETFLRQTPTERAKS